MPMPMPPPPPLPACAADRRLTTPTKDVRASRRDDDDSNNGHKAVLPFGRLLSREPGIEAARVAENSLTVHGPRVGGPLAR
jgi:hypothetical protein